MPAELAAAIVALAFLVTYEALRRSWARVRRSRR